MKAYELLDSPDKFTTNLAARNIQDICVDSESKEACKWCVYGAIIRCYGQDEAMNKIREFAAFLKLSMAETFRWNDTTPFEQVVAKLREFDI